MTKLTTMLNGGSECDIVYIKEADGTPSYADKGQLEDLTSYIEADGIDTSKFVGYDDFNLDGKQVALPFKTDYYVLYYNKDIFDAAGVDYPSNDMTWTEWEEMCKSLTSGEGNDKIYGGYLHTWQACVQNWAVQDGANTILGPDYSFMKPYYEMALRMQEEGTIMDYATLKTGNIAYASPFQQGTVATADGNLVLLHDDCESKRRRDRCKLGNRNPSASGWRRSRQHRWFHNTDGYQCKLFS